MAKQKPTASSRGRHVATQTTPSVQRVLRKLTSGPAKHAAPAPTTDPSPVVRTAVLGVAAATLPIGMGIGAPAMAGTQVGGSGNTFFMHDGTSNTAPAITYGRDGDEVHVGNFDGAGTDQLMVRRSNAMHISTSSTNTQTASVVSYGRPGDVTLVGDWDGDGVDTYAVRRGNVYHFTNSVDGSTTDFTIAYGRPGDEVLVGDWDGDGMDSLAVRRGNVYYFSTTLSSTQAETVIAYGRAGDSVITGDWDGNGTDTLAVRRGTTFMLSNTLAGGAAQQAFDFGRPADIPMAGDWDGDGVDTVGLRRPAPKPEPAPAPAPQQSPYAVTGVWAQLAQCESGGNPTIVSRNGLYHGLYQFSVQTWRSVGGQGLPSQASPEEQTKRAQILQARSGWGQWPACSRKLGLR